MSKFQALARIRLDPTQDLANVGDILNLRDEGTIDSLLRQGAILEVSKDDAPAAKTADILFTLPEEISYPHLKKLAATLDLETTGKADELVHRIVTEAHSQEAIDAAVATL